MSFFPGDSQVFGPLLVDPEVAALFSDEAFVRRMVEVEAALARVQGELGVIPEEAARRIDAEATSFAPDLTDLGESTRLGGVPVMGLVRQLRGAVGGDEASYVHWGATSQDVMDTALVLQLRDGTALLETKLRVLVHDLADLAETHRDTLVLARTRTQSALPTTFGLKVASWLAPLTRHRVRLTEMKPRFLCVQLGGAAGTLASLGAEGPAVVEGLGRELGLGAPLSPWHVQRDGLIELAGWLSLVTGTLGKMAQDVMLMGQDEVGELSEASDPGRGGSSTMPQKRNPVRSEAVVAAARHNAALLSSMHQAALHEHERGGAAWQMEWLSLPQMMALTSGAVRNASDVAGGVQVHQGRMADNVKGARGMVMAEAAAFLLSRHMGRAEALRTVREAAQSAEARGAHLIDVLEETLSADVDWSEIRDERAWLGQAGRWVEAVVAEARRG